VGKPRFEPRGLLANPERFGRAGADWTGWQTRPLDQGKRPVDQDVAASVAWLQHHLALRLRRHLRYPSADDPHAEDKYNKADDPHPPVGLAKRFADHCGLTKGVLVARMSGIALADHPDLHQWAHEAGTTVAEVLEEEGSLPPE